MKASRIVYLSAAMLLLAGCSAEQSPEQDGSLLPIVLGSTVADAPLTRAANNLNNTYLAAGQQVTVRISPTGENNYNDYTYTTAASGVMTPPAENKPYYPMTGNVNIRAYHPASAATGSSAATFSVAANQTENDAYIASDLLWADTDNEDNALDNLPKTASTRTLKFQHKLSKITVNATPDGVAVTSITGITLNNVKRKVTFNPSTGATALAESNNDATTVTMSNNGSAIIPAQPISGTFITITTDEGSALYTLSTTLESGHQYTFNIAVNGAAINTTNTITDWNDVTTTTSTSLAITPPEAVDLGIVVNDKTILFANKNIGAMTESDYGSYFMWGDVVGYGGAVNPGTTTAADGFDFDFSNYRWCNGSYTTLTKYCNDSYYGNDGFTDNKTTLDAADDAAAVMWGNGWRMPTKAEMDKLVGTKSNTENYTWTWCDGTTVKYNNSSVSGYKITRNSSGATIFLPAAGYRDGSSLVDQGSYGYYWSSSLDTEGVTNAWSLYFDSSSAYENEYYGSRYYGYTVRPVQSN